MLDFIETTEEHRTPKPRVIRFNETYYWSDEIKEVVKNIYADYVYDDSVAYYLCDTSPAFFLEAYNIDIEFKDELTIEEIDYWYDRIIHAHYENDNAHYQYCRYIESRSIDASNYVPYPEATMEDIIDRLRSNPPYFKYEKNN
jgi:hypothetical protein